MYLCTIFSIKLSNFIPCFGMITVLTIDDREGALEDALQLFKKLSLSLARIESRPSKTYRWKYDILLEVKRIDEQQLAELSKQLPAIVSSFQFIQSEEAASTEGKGRN
jgi:prephenate dehydratase